MVEVGCSELGGRSAGSFLRRGDRRNCELKKVGREVTEIIYRGYWGSGTETLTTSSLNAAVLNAGWSEIKFISTLTQFALLFRLHLCTSGNVHKNQMAP
jgi:hypothetical protein